MAQRHDDRLRFVDLDTFQRHSGIYLTVTALAGKVEKHNQVALGFFAGIRPDEIKALDWRNVNFDRKEIKVTAGTAKTKDSRYVRMSPNLIAWLLPHRKTDGLIFYSKRFFNSTRKKAGVMWANDIMRHTYASNHCVIHGTDDTADQLGHKGKSMLFKHYRRAVSESEAKLFWEIRPSVKDNVVEFKTA